MISFDPLWGVPQPICTSMCFRAHEPCLKAQAEQMRLVASSSGVIAVHGQALRPPYAREHANAASASHANAPRACRRWHGCSFFPPQRIAPPQSKSFFGPGSIDVAHRADEWLDRSDLARTVDIVQDLVYRRCIAA